MSRLLTAGAITLLLAGCSGGQKASSDDEMKKALDQLVQTSKEQVAQAKEGANAAKSTNDGVKALVERVGALEKSMATALAGQKRGAMVVTLDVDATCDNDEQCVNTARAMCNRINYPNAVTLRFTPGLRPSLHSLVCFD